MKRNYLKMIPSENQLPSFEVDIFKILEQFYDVESEEFPKNIKFVSREEIKSEKTDFFGK